MIILQIADYSGTPAQTATSWYLFEESTKDISKAIYKAENTSDLFIHYADINIDPAKVYYLYAVRHLADNSTRDTNLTQYNVPLQVTDPVDTSTLPIERPIVMITSNTLPTGSLDIQVSDIRPADNVFVSNLVVIHNSKNEVILFKEYNTNTISISKADIPNYKADEELILSVATKSKYRQSEFTRYPIDGIFNKPSLELYDHIDPAKDYTPKLLNSTITINNTKLIDINSRSVITTGTTIDAKYLDYSTDYILEIDFDTNNVFKSLRYVISTLPQFDIYYIDRDLHYSNTFTTVDVKYIPNATFTEKLFYGGIPDFINNEFIIFRGKDYTDRVALTPTLPIIDETKDIFILNYDVNKCILIASGTSTKTVNLIEINPAMDTAKTIASNSTLLSNLTRGTDGKYLYGIKTVGADIHLYSFDVYSGNEVDLGKIPYTIDDKIYPQDVGLDKIIIIGNMDAIVVYDKKKNTMDVVKDTPANFKTDLLPILRYDGVAIYFKDNEYLTYDIMTDTVVTSTTPITLPRATFKDRDGSIYFYSMLYSPTPVNSGATLYK